MADFLEDWPHIDSYAIYKRYQKSQHYGFEFLDISKGPQEGYEDCYYNVVISNHKKILSILENIISNPKSSLKRYVKDISITIQILQGREELINTEMDNEFTLEDFFWENVEPEAKAMSWAVIRNNLFHTMSVQDNYQNDRWIGDGSVLRERTFHGRDRERFFTKKEFPERVHIKKLLGVSIMLNFLQKENNRHIIRNVKDNDELTKVDPFRDYENYMISKFGPIPSFEHDFREFRDYLTISSKYLGLKEIKETNIENRELFTAAEVQNILSKMMMTMACNHTNGSANSSFMLSGSLGKDSYEVDYAYSPHNEIARNYFITFIPFTMLFNKPEMKKLAVKKMSLKHLSRKAEDQQKRI